MAQSKWEADEQHWLQKGMGRRRRSKPTDWDLLDTKNDNKMNISRRVIRRHEVISHTKGGNSKVELWSRINVIILIPVRGQGSSTVGTSATPLVVRQTQIQNGGEPAAHAESRQAC